MQNLSPSIRHLRDLIAIPSVNPMGRDDLPPEIVGEHAVAEHLSRALGKLGLDAALVGEGGRTSVVAEARATNAMDTLLVASHSLPVFIVPRLLRTSLQTMHNPQMLDILGNVGGGEASAR